MAERGGMYRKIADRVAIRDIRVIADVNGLAVYADQLFEKVFLNMIDNALWYGGQMITMIRITSQEKGQELVIFVEDDEPGFQRITGTTSSNVALGNTPAWDSSSPARSSRLPASRLLRPVSRVRVRGLKSLCRRGPAGFQAVPEYTAPETRPIRFRTVSSYWKKRG